MESVKSGCGDHIGGGPGWVVWVDLGYRDLVGGSRDCEAACRFLGVRVSLLTLGGGFSRLR